MKQSGSQAKVLKNPNDFVGRKLNVEIASLLVSHLTRLWQSIACLTGMLTGSISVKQTVHRRLCISIPDRVERLP
jgi:hypothetical protein